VRESKQLSPPTEEGEFIDLEKEFEKNIVNSAVYIISMTMQISNFAVNYKGHPFMVSLTDNKPLFYSLLVTSAVILSLAAGVVSDFSQWLEIVEFPNEFQVKLLAVLAVDFIATFVIDRILFYFLGTSKLRKL
jgi:cation-transporting ATPase 13A1